jgi:hypothetical protein
MPLTDYEQKRRTVSFNGGEFSVRAVSLPDLAGLISRNHEVIDHLAAVVQAQQELDFSDAQAVFDIVFNVIKESPFLVADLITSCSDEAGVYETVFRMPVTVQIEALEGIADLTFADAVALKNFVAAIRRLIAGMIPMRNVIAAA